MRSSIYEACAHVPRVEPQTNDRWPARDHGQTLTTAGGPEGRWSGMRGAMDQPGGGKPDARQPNSEKPGGAPDAQRRGRRRRGRRPPDAVGTESAPQTPRWAAEPGTKICRKCGGRMQPADWIWQKYGLCLGWRCVNCKEKVMARSLPFKGLRKRTLDPDEVPPPTPHALSDRTPVPERPVPPRTGDRTGVGQTRPPRPSHLARRPSPDRRSRPR